MQEVTEIQGLNIKSTLEADDYAFIVDTVGVNDEVQKVQLNNIDFSNRLETVVTSSQIDGDGTVGSPLTIAPNSLTTTELATGTLLDEKIAADAITLNTLDFLDATAIGQGVVYGSAAQFESTPIYNFATVAGSGIGVYSGLSGTTAQFKTLSADGAASVSSDANNVTIDISGSAFSPKTNIDVGAVTSTTPDIVTNDSIVIETAGNLTINNPTSYTGTNGKFITFKIKQGTGAPHTVSWGTEYDFQDFTPTYSTAETKFDVYLFQADETNTAMRLVVFNTGFDPGLWSPLNLGSKLRAWVKPEGGYVDLANNVGDVLIGSSTRPSISTPALVTSDTKTFAITQSAGNMIAFNNAQQLQDNDVNNTDYDTFIMFGLETGGDNQYYFNHPATNDNTISLTNITYAQDGNAGTDFDFRSRKGDGYSGIVTERVDNFYIFTSETLVDEGYINGSLVTNTNLAANFSTVQGTFWSVCNLVSGDGTTFSDFASTSEILELIVTDPVTQAERELVEGYLAWRSGRVDVLPGGHPYKTVRPSNP